MSDRRVRAVMSDLGIKPGNADAVVLQLAENVLQLNRRVEQLERDARSPFDIGRRFRNFVAKAAPAAKVRG